MATRAGTMRALATRIGKVPGWRVEKGSSGDGFKVYAPDGSFVTGIHLTPGDVRSDDIVLRTCDAAGFRADEEKYLAKIERERKRRIEAEQQKAVVAAARVAKTARTQTSLRAKAAGPFAAVEEFDVRWLLGRHAVPDVRAGIVTPELATKVLEHNPLNRPKKLATIRTVRKALQDDRWLLTHEAAALDTEGHLLDGQNRFMVIEETGIAAPMFMFVGMDPRTRYVIGQQSVRTAADAFHMAGIPQPNNCAAVVRSVAMYDKPFIAWKSFKMSNDEVIAVYRQDPDGYLRAVHDGVNTAGGAGRKRRIRVAYSTLGASIYLIRRAGNPDKLVDEYLEGLRSGANLRDGDPRVSLVDWFNWVHMGKHPIARYEPFAMLILSWNAWVQGDTVRNLKWRNRTEFPNITVRK